MIYVAYDTPDDQGWKDWDAEAIVRAADLKKNFKFEEKPKIDTAFYKQQRELLMRRFHRKCAYCETRIDRFPIDVEHYRPKGRVSDGTRTIVTVLDQNGNKRDHLGYYWLAYSWENLLPSCHMWTAPIGKCFF